MMFTLYRLIIKYQILATKLLSHMLVLNCPYIVTLFETQPTTTETNYFTTFLQTADIVLAFSK